MTRFNLEKGLRHILRFEGLNYAADIRFNGKLIASADTTYGTFCVREFDITSLAKKRYNTLEVTVHKAPEACLNTGFADWNPRPVDENMGIIRPVLLISTPDVQIQDIYVKPIVNPKNLKEASFEVLTTLVNRSAKPVTHTLEGKYDDGGSFSEKVTLAGGETRLVKHIEKVANPRIWWSCDMGTPEMYTLSVRVGDQQRSVRFGLRDISSEVDVYGHRLFYLNGRPVFLKSAGWTDDIFLQDTPEKLRTQALFVKDMGLNCIRFENIWGKDDTIYDICDELGLLTFVGWSCQWEWKSYCGIPETKGFGCINDPQTEALAIRYFHDQVIRLVDRFENPLIVIPEISHNEKTDQKNQDRPGKFPIGFLRCRKRNLQHHHSDKNGDDTIVEGGKMIDHTCLETLFSLSALFKHVIIFSCAFITQESADKSGFYFLFHRSPSADIRLPGSVSRLNR